MEELFEKYADRYINLSKAGDKLKLRLLRRLGKAGDSFLDVAGGSGYFADKVLLETPISSVTVLEKSKAMLQANKILPNKNLIHGTVLDLPFKAESFNFVHADGLLHHLVGRTRIASLEKAQQALRNLYAVTKRGGALILSEIILDSVFDSLSSSIVFYSLRLLLRVRPLNRLFRIPDGLLVSFLTSRELMEMVRGLGASSLESYENLRKVTIPWRLALVTKHGVMHLFIFKPDSS